jgi:hypothetical protein
MKLQLFLVWPVFGLIQDFQLGATIDL